MRAPSPRAPQIAGPRVSPAYSPPPVALPYPGITSARQVTNGATPNAVNEPGACVHPNGLIYYFGGLGVSTETNGFFSFNPLTNTFVQITTVHTPSARADFTMLFDPISGTIIGFGGTNGSVNLNDTWSIDPTVGTPDWTQLSPGTVPGIRAEQSFFYHPINGQICMYGGVTSTNTTVLDDLWTWNGTNWVLLSSAFTGTARTSHMCAAGNGIVVISGGQKTGGVFFFDTQVWNGVGTTSTSLTTSTAPGGRGYAGFGYDPSIEEFVLVGGINASINFTDVWILNGWDWTEIDPVVGDQMVLTDQRVLWHPGLGQLVSFGGFDAVAGVKTNGIWYINCNSVITHVQQVHAVATNQATVTIQPKQIGDLLVLPISIGSATVTVTGITDTGITPASGAGAWTRQAVSPSTASNSRVELWTAVASAVVSGTVTATYSGTPGGGCELTIDEWTGDTVQMVWTVLSTAELETSGSATAIAFPALSAPSPGGQLYYAYTYVANSGAAGSTPGCTYYVLSSTSNIIVADSTMWPANRANPAASQSGAGTYNSVAAMIQGVPATQIAATISSSADISANLTAGGGTTPVASAISASAALVAGNAESVTLDGSDPIATSAVTAVVGSAAALDGADVLATSTLAAADQKAVALDGSDPVATSAVTAVMGESVTLDGADPVATSALTAQVSKAIALDGADPAPASAVAAGNAEAVALDGSHVAATSAVTAQVGVVFPLSASIGCSSAVSAQSTAVKALTAAIAASLGVTANDIEVVALATSIAANASLVANESEAVALAAAITASSAVTSSSMSIVLPLSASLACSASPGALNRENVAVSASVAATSAVTGNAVPASGLSTSITASSSAAAGNTELVAVSAFVTDTSAITGNAPATSALKASIAPSSSVAAGNGETGSLAALVSVSVSVSAGNTEAEVIAATIVGTSSLSAATAKAAGLTAAITNSMAITANITVSSGGNLSSAISNSAALIAGNREILALDGADVAGAASVTASNREAFGLDGSDVSATSGVIAANSSAGSLSTSLSGSGSLTAPNAETRALSSSTNGTSTLSAANSGTAKVSSSIAGALGVTANVTGTTGGALSAAVAGSSSLSGASREAVALSASMNAMSGAAGELTARTLLGAVISASCALSGTARVVTNEPGTVQLSDTSPTVVVGDMLFCQVQVGDAAVTVAVRDSLFGQVQPADKATFLVTIGDSL